jgi:hypothetical protein
MARHDASAPRDALLFHLAFGLACAAVVWLTPQGRFGLAVLGLTLAYHLLLVGFALLRGHADWLSRWAFLLPVSLLQVLPDWVLVAITETLYFPDHGIARIGGAVPLYFMGLWMMILFPVTLVADAAGPPRYLVAAVLGGVAFTVAEWMAAPLGLWVPRNVETVAGMATYPIPAEILLCLVCLWLYRATRGQPWPGRLLAAATIPVTYTGALMLALLALR